MAVRYLSDGELQRVRYELGHNVLELGALPYVGHRQIFAVIQENCASDAQDPTTSTTAVTAAGPASLTLASVTGIAQGARVVLDVDDAREVVTVRAVSGSAISVVCRKTHGGTYPVEIESALTLVRGVLSDLTVNAEKIRDDGGDIKQVDEVTFFGEGGFDDSSLGRAYEKHIRLRRELASLVGIESNRGGRGGGSSYEVY